MDRLQARQGKATTTQFANIYSFFAEGLDTTNGKQARTRLKAAAKA